MRKTWPQVSIYLRWAAKSFSLVELAVLGAIRDAAYKAPNGACSLTVSEIAQPG